MAIAALLAGASAPYVSASRRRRRAEYFTLAEAGIRCAGDSEWITPVGVLNFDAGIRAGRVSEGDVFLRLK